MGNRLLGYGLAVDIEGIAVADDVLRIAGEGSDIGIGSQRPGPGIIQGHLFEFHLHI